MIIDSPIFSGSYAATGSLNQIGNVTITGSLTVTGTINASITGSITTASYALSAELLDGLDSTSFVFTSSFNTVSSSFSTRVTNLENFSSSLDATFATDAELAAVSQSFSSSLSTVSGSLSSRVTNNEVTGSNLTTASGSFSTRTTNLELASGSFSTRVTDLETASGSFSTRVTTAENNITNLQNASSSFSTRVTSAENSIVSIQGATSSYATTGSNNFVGTQYISATNNAIGFTTTASLYTDGGIRVAKDMYVSGNAYFNNVTIYGTQSVQYITSSQLNISTNLISVNTDTPTIRFGGLAVYDSGSTGLSGSLLWDSEQNHWVYSNPSGSTYSGGMLISGPRASSLGTEQGTTACALMMGQGGDHITSSAIFHYGNTTCFYGNSYITSSGGAYFSGNVGVGLENPIAKLEASKFQGHGLRINYCTDQSVSAGAACQGGIYAVNCGLNGYPLIVDEVSSNVTGGQYPVLIRSLASAGTPAAGMATGIHFGVPDNASNVNVAQMAFRTTDADSSTYTMRWDMRMKNLGSYQTNFIMLGDGSLALGTNGTAPSYKLDVSGCARITGDACIGGNTLINGCVGIGTTCIMDTLTVGNNGGLALQRFSGATTFSSDLYFFGTRGSQGTPTAKLNGDVAMGIRPRAYDGTSYLDVAAIESKLDGVTSTNVMYGNLIFSTNNGSTTLTERMRITSGGNVGIGAVSPASKFHICGSTNDIGVRMTNTTANKSYMAYSDTSCNYIIYDISKDSNRMTIFNDGQVSFVCQICVPQVISSGTITGTTLYGSTAICGGVICGTGLTINNGNAHLNINFNTGTSAGWDVKTYFTGGNSGSEQFIYFGFPGGTTDAFIQRGSNSRLDLGTSSTARLSISATGIACFACTVCAPIVYIGSCLLIDQTTSLTTGLTGARVEMSGYGDINATSQSSYNVFANHGTNSTWTGYLVFNKSRGTTQGSVTAVASGDRLGMIRFNGTDGTEQIRTAEIYSEVDASVSKCCVPSRIIFATAGSNLNGPIERFRISSNGAACFACELTAKTLGTNDLILNNLNYEHANYVDGTRGSWLIQEGACDLFIINQVSCKKYKFNLIEIE